MTLLIFLGVLVMACAGLALIHISLGSTFLSAPWAFGIPAAFAILPILTMLLIAIAWSPQACEPPGPRNDFLTGTAAFYVLLSLMNLPLTPIYLCGGIWCAVRKRWWHAIYLVLLLLIILLNVMMIIAASADTRAGCFGG
jgi:hypothetical protein